MFRAKYVTSLANDLLYIKNPTLTHPIFDSSDMDSIDNNQFEVKPVTSKRKIAAPRPNVYLNPALDLLANEDRMCNTAMEVPHKKRKRTKSCDIATFENSALDLGISGAAVNKFLVQELENVKRNLNHANENDDSNAVLNNVESNTCDSSVDTTLDQASVPHLAPRCRNPVNFDITNVAEKSVSDAQSIITEPIYANVTTADTNTNNETENTNMLQCPDISRIPHDFEIDSGISIFDQKSLTTGNNDSPNICNITNIQTNITNQVALNNSTLGLSFIDRLAIESPNASDQSLYLDDDLNESNIMEIKTITIITTKKRIIEKKNTNPFLNPNLNTNEFMPKTNPFLDMNPEIEYHDAVLNRPVEVPDPSTNILMPKRLFSGETNSTISTMNESLESHDYENIDHFRSGSPIYENIEEANTNKQSKILGCDVSQFSAIDIMNLNKNSQANSSNESETKKDLKHSFLKASNKLSKKVFKTLKKTFKHDKVDSNATLNPYEVPRKPPKQKECKKEAGIENPALNLDNSDDIEIEEISDEDHQYETIKTRRNTQLNMNVTPLRVRDNDIDFLLDKSTPGKITSGKKVRFDSTLNQEKVITGNSFDDGMQSPGFDAKIDKYHDELENCINERKFLQQNM